MSSLTLVRRIAARPSIVFEAMTTNEGLAAWFGPDELPALSSTAASTKHAANFWSSFRRASGYPSATDKKG